MNRIKPRRLPLMTIALSACTMLGLSLTAQSTEPDKTQLAVQALAEQLVAVEKEIRDSRFFDSEQDRAKAYMHLVRTLIAGLETEVLQDKDLPYLRATDFWLREGADNPDQRYSYSPIHGGETYRIWGKIGSAYRLEVNLYAGAPWASSGRSAGYLAHEQIDVNEDGTFEIFLSRDKMPGNWLENPADASTVMMRQVYNEWSDQFPGEIHIDRVGYEHKRSPEMTAAEVAKRLEAASDTFRQHALVWPNMTENIITGAWPANVVPTLQDRGDLGGVPGRLMAMGHFEVPKGQALLIKAPQSHGVYQGIQLADRWLASLEYGNLISSLNTAQAHLSADGNYYYVIAADDPGYINWLDTGGLNRGVFIMRYDGVPMPLDPSIQPSAELIPIEALATRIPDFRSETPAEREHRRAERRRHVQVRANR